MDHKKRAIIVGAGPAGLTAAYELMKRSPICPVVFEMSGDIGGISKTVNYRGNRMDIGGHRFFSKSDRVIKLWKEILPLQGAPALDEKMLGIQSFVENPNGPDPDCADEVMLVRRRISRIFFLRKFFDYPLTLSPTTVSNLGIWRLFKIGVSYIRAHLKPIRPERNLEQFFINRFGKELYRTFFKYYTQKVWGVPCKMLDASWGAQRIKGLNAAKAIAHAVKKILFFQDSSLEQKQTETSLIEKFMYPKYGPGQIWELVAEKIRQGGGEVNLNWKATKIHSQNQRVVSVELVHRLNGEKRIEAGDYFISSMPVKDLVGGFEGDPVPPEVFQVAQGLAYRDFITVGLLLSRFKIKNQTKVRTVHNIIPDNWIYIQERDVKVGRVQIFNNWSPYMVKDLNHIWIGLEYFCTEGDSLWKKTDEKMQALAVREMVKIGFFDEGDVLDSTVVRMPKTYPAYHGAYAEFERVKDFLNPYENLFLVGRNGMHKYNNSDHSMLTAMVAVDNILEERKTKKNIWEINTEEEYCEEKKAP